MTLDATLGASLAGILADLPGALGERAPVLALRFEAAFARPAFGMTIVRGERSAEVRCHRHRQTLVGLVQSVAGFTMTAEVLGEMAEDLAQSARPAPCHCLPRSGKLMVVLWAPAGGHFAFSDGTTTAACSVQVNPHRN
jgi:hypothetical protein